MKIVPAQELARAEDKLHRAEKLQDSLPGLAAQQAYLAMFAAARARISASGGEDNKSHKSVQTALHDLYRDVPGHNNAGKQLQRAYAWKQIDDYGGGQMLNLNESQAAVEQAAAFIASMRHDVEAVMGELHTNAEVDPALLAELDRRSRQRGD